LNGFAIARLALCACFLLATASDALAKMYRWVDENGKVHFTDNPAKIPEAFRESPDGKKKPPADEEEAMSPLHRAALAGDTATIEKLVDEGANVNAFDSEGMTALHFAAEKGRLPAVKLLLNMGARYDIRNQQGKTAADLARQKGKEDVAGLLERHQAKSEKKRARRPARPDPYKDVASATGGQVFRFKKGMAGADEVLIATYQAKILLSTRLDLKGRAQEVPVPIESGTTSALFTVTADKGLPEALALIDPAGAMAMDNPAQAKVVSLENGSAVVVKNPAAGNWRVRVAGRGPVEVRVDVKTGQAAGAASASAVDFHEFEFVELRGRPGHQGFFTTRHPLVPGAKMKSKATIFGEVSGIRLTLVDEAGAPFENATREPVAESAESWDYLADFYIPDRPFRVQLSGKNEKGEAVSRVYSERFDPRPDLVNLTLRTGTDARRCVTALNLFAYPFESEAGGGETMFISCPIPEKETPNPDLDIVMTAYAKAPKPGAGGRAVFVSHPKQKLNTNRCWAALELFDSLQKEGKTRALQYAWKADCKGSGSDVRLVVEWTLSAGKR